MDHDLPIGLTEHEVRRKSHSAHVLFQSPCFAFEDEISVLLYLSGNEDDGVLSDVRVSSRNYRIEPHDYMMSTNNYLFIRNLVFLRRFTDLVGLFQFFNLFKI